MAPVRYRTRTAKRSAEKKETAHSRRCNDACINQGLVLVGIVSDTRLGTCRPHRISGFLRAQWEQTAGLEAW